MGLALNVSRDVTADVGARRGAQPREIATEVLESRRRPPKTQRVRVVAQLLARIKIVRLEQCLRTFELLVGVVVLVVEVRDFFVHRFDRGARFVRRGLRDQRDWANVALRVVTEVDGRDQARIDKISLKP